MTPPLKKVRRRFLFSFFHELDKTKFLQLKSPRNVQNFVWYKNAVTQTFCFPTLSKKLREKRGEDGKKGDKAEFACRNDVCVWLLRTKWEDQNKAKVSKVMSTRIDDIGNRFAYKLNLVRTKKAMRTLSYHTYKHLIFMSTYTECLTQPQNPGFILIYRGDIVNGTVCSWRVDIFRRRKALPLKLRNSSVLSHRPNSLIYEFLSFSFVPFSLSLSRSFGSQHRFLRTCLLLCNCLLLLVLAVPLSSAASLRCPETWRSSLRSRHPYTPGEDLLRTRFACKLSTPWAIVHVTSYHMNFPMEFGMSCLESMCRKFHNFCDYHFYQSALRHFQHSTLRQYFFTNINYEMKNGNVKSFYQKKN